MSTEIEVNRVNLWHVLPIMLGLVLTVCGWGITWQTQVALNEKALDQINELKADVSTIQTTLPTIVELQYRINQVKDKVELNEKGVQRNSDKTDTMILQFNNKMSTIERATQKLLTQMQIIATMIDGDKKSVTDRLKETE